MARQQADHALVSDQAAARLDPPGIDPSRDPMVLVAADDPTQAPRLFACRTCGNAYSVKNIGVQNARDMAVNCNDCRPKQYRCDVCGCATPQYRLRCDKCRYEEKLAAAVEVPDDGGPYCVFDGDTYYYDLDEAADAGLAWVSPCTVTYPRICADIVLENLLDDMHEDASVDDLDATEAFEAAVKAFNEAQTTRSYFGDNKRKIRVPSCDSDEHRNGEDAQRLSGEAMPARAEGIAETSSNSKDLSA